MFHPSLIPYNLNPVSGEDIHHNRLIVAMKGHPGTGKSTLARSLAELVHNSFISLDDIRDSISKVLQSFPNDTVSSPDSVSERIDDLSYDAVCRVASLFVQMGSEVFIDCSLSRRSHCDQLLQASDAIGAKLVIVECKPQDIHEWQRRLEKDNFEAPYYVEDLQKLSQGHGDYDVGDIRKLTVNTTTYFDTFPVGIAVIVLYESPRVHHLEFHKWEAEGHKRLVDDEPSADQKQSTKEQEENEERDMHHIGHVHEFSLFEGPKDDAESEISCRGCLKPILGTAYSCTGCRFFLHKSCAESPNEVQIEPYSRDLPFLKPMAEEYCFPETYSCSPNNSFSFECWSCLFMTHLRCGFLPSVLNHPCHDHPLLFQIHRIRFYYEFQCRACGKTGNHVSYSCPKCYLYVHVNCAFLPLTSKHHYHRHNLSLSPPSYEDSDDEFYCDICETKGNPKNWVYCCPEPECDYASHVECAASGS